MQDEDIIYSSKLHPIVYLKPLIFLVFGAGLWYFVPMLYLLSILFMAVGGLGFISFSLALQFSAFQIRRRSILIQSGVWARQSVNLPISKIETVDVRQPLLGALLNYGTIILVGTGGTQNYFQNLANPLTCRRHLEALINAE